MLKFVVYSLVLGSVFGCAHAQNGTAENLRAPATSSNNNATDAPICLPTGDLCSDENHQMILNVTDGARKRADDFDKKYASDLTKVSPPPSVAKALDDFNKSSPDMKPMYLRNAVDAAIDACQVTTSGTGMAELLQEKAVQEGMNCGFGDMGDLADLQSRLDDMRLNYCYRSMKALATLDEKVPKMKRTPMVAHYPEQKDPKALDQACKKQLDSDTDAGAHEAPIYYAGCMSSWRAEYVATIIGQLRKFRKAIPADAPL